MNISNQTSVVLFLLLNVGLLFGQDSPIPPVPVPDPIPHAEPLAIAFDYVEIEIVESTFKRQQIMLDEQEVAIATKSAAKRNYKQNAVVVRVTTVAKFINVVARMSLFELAEVSKIADGSYLIRGPPGTYLVEVESFDPILGIERATGTIKIESTGEDPPTTEPDLPPNGQFDELAKLAADLVRQIDDDATNQLLVHEIDMALGILREGKIELEQANIIIKAAIEKALVSRVGESLKKNWLEGFRKPLNEAFEKAGIASTAQLIQIWRLIRDELAKKAASTTPSVSIVPLTTSPASGVQRTFTEPVYEFRPVTVQKCTNGVCRTVTEFRWIQVK
jgi:hypothetical protein